MVTKSIKKGKIQFTGCGIYAHCRRWRKCFYGAETMKKTVTKIVFIFLFIILYSVFQNVLFCHFLKDIDQYVADAQAAKTADEIQTAHKNLTEYFDDNQLLFYLTVPKNELELIEVSLGRMIDYLDEGLMFEAKVAAGEINSYMKSMGDGLILKK